MRGRQIWASKSVALLDHKLDLNQKYGILEINPLFFTAPTEIQKSQMNEWHRLYEARRLSSTDPLIQKIMVLFSIHTSIRAEDMPVTRKFLSEQLNLLISDQNKTEVVLAAFENVFGIYYSEKSKLQETEQKWLKVYAALSKPKWTQNHNPVGLNIYHFGKTYMEVYDEKIKWFKDEDIKSFLKEEAVSSYQYDKNFIYTPTFMRVLPTKRTASTNMPFADVQSHAERKANYFRFKKQLKETFESFGFSRDKNLPLEQLFVHTEFLARMHQAMIYYHFWEQLNGRMTRAYMSLFNAQYGLLPVILNVEPEFIDEKYKKANQIDLISGRSEKWKYHKETYASFVTPTKDWIITQQIKAEQFYAELEALR